MKRDTLILFFLVALVLSTFVNFAQQRVLAQQRIRIDLLESACLTLEQKQRNPVSPSALKRKHDEWYTVEVGGGLGLKFTNVVEVVPNHEPGCQLIKYLGPNGTTNEFHAWAVPIHVSTNP